MQEDFVNKLYFGDNLDIMRNYIPDESVDLIYLDPPFNSKASYNVLFQDKDGEQSGAQITAFDDTWHWGSESEEAYYEIVKEGSSKLSELIQALRSFLGQNDMMAYIVMMAARLKEMHRILKDTGSIYLHCDPTASHYLKLVMDSIFSIKNFRNEIIWVRGTASGGKAGGYKFVPNHDVILFYIKDVNYAYYERQYIDYTDEYIKQRFKYKDEKGRKYRLQLNNRRQYLDKSKGKPVSDIWDQIYPINPMAKEKLGYPTQKPEALLERIIKASSNEGDIILDTFCGCGTTIAVAERLKRKWIGIDITHLAINLMKNRLVEAFQNELSLYEVWGEPKNVSGAKALAEHDRFQFEWWALGKVAARPAGDKKKGADSGIDGLIYFFDDNTGKAKKIIVQVKSGNVKRNDIATLKGDMEREKAVISAFITLKEPTKPMLDEAFSVGFYEPEFFPGTKYYKVQILTIKDLLEGKQLEYPRVAPESTFKRAERKRKNDNQQSSLKF